MRYETTDTVLPTMELQNPCRIVVINSGGAIVLQVGALQWMWDAQTGTFVEGTTVDLRWEEVK